MQRSKTTYKNKALEGLLCLIGFETIKSLGKYLLRSDHEVQWLVSSLTSVQQTSFETKSLPVGHEKKMKDLSLFWTDVTFQLFQTFKQRMFKQQSV